ncbi:MAG TPA: FHA domain-containing protein [Gemmatimonadaceae bacterium]
MPFLHLAGQTRELAPGETIVGSGALASWRVAGQNLAARHFTVRVDEGARVRLAPFSPQHVVVIAGRQVGVEGQELADGDMVAAGSAHFVYTREAGGAHTPAVEPPREALLLVERAQRAHPIEGRSFSIGRDRASSIVLRDAAVSRFHAEVRPEAGRHVLYSTGSGGTRVNGRRIDGPHVLDEGDVIEIGGTSLRYTLGGAPDGWAIARGGDETDEETGRRATLGTHTIPDPAEEAPRRGARVGMMVIVAIAIVVAAVVWVGAGR